MTVHDFGASLAYSHQQADQPWWEEVYRSTFVDFAAMVDLRRDGWHQRAGRDRAIVLSSGRTIFVDEKVRRKDYGKKDVLVEVWSVYPKSGVEPYGPDAKGTKKPGWAAELKDCDWLAYAIEPTRVCYLFPHLGIRAAFEENRIAWITNATARAGGYSWQVAKNPTYNTINIAVPLDDLYQAVAESMTIKWGRSGGRA